MDRQACLDDTSVVSLDVQHAYQLLRTLVACAQEVRQAVVRAERHRLADIVGLGADGSDTTHIDAVAEEVALAWLEHAEPRMNILSEEAGLLDRGSALTAIVDPIDATNNATAVANVLPRPDEVDLGVAIGAASQDHVLGFPFFAFSAGVLLDERIVAGCVMNLPTGDVFTCARGHGVHLDGVPVGSRTVTTMREARIALIRPETPAAWRAMGPIMVGARRVRITGCSALDLALIACGTLDALVNPNRISPAGWGEKIVDYAGALAMLEETGGVLTDYDGAPVPVGLDLTTRAPLLGAATPALHADLVETLRQASWDDLY